MKYSKIDSFGILIMALLGLIFYAGCMKLGPQYRKPDIGIQTPVTYQHATSGTQSSNPLDRWWEAFGNPQINQLVVEAFSHNLDIKKTRLKFWRYGRDSNRRGQTDFRI